jgi:hypothetical protein
MPNLPSTMLAEAFNADLTFQQIAGLLDLIGVAFGIWTIWSSISLPLGGNLQRAFRLIGFGTLAFACSHVIDSFVTDLHLATDEQGLLLMQATVIISMLFFVPGLAGLAEMLPALPIARKPGSFPQVWAFTLPIIIVIGAFSFIIYGVSPAGETVAFTGLDGLLNGMALLCIVLVVRARIGGVIGRSLWMAMVGMMLFCLAHPLQILLYDKANLPDGANNILHRLIVIPALLLFAISITRLGRKLSASLQMAERLRVFASISVAAPQPHLRRGTKYGFSARDRARRSTEREHSLSGASPSRPFPAQRPRATQD